MNDVQIRMSRPSDADRICDILRDTFRSTWWPHLSEADRLRFEKEDHQTAYFTARGHQFWVAARQETVIGFVDWSDDFVNALHVHSSAAGFGTGSALMDLAENHIAAAGFAEAKLETHTFNTRSRAFYAKRGFMERDEYADTDWQSGLTTLLLVKPLA